MYKINDCKLIIDKPHEGEADLICDLAYKGFAVATLWFKYTGELITCRPYDPWYVIKDHNHNLVLALMDFKSSTILDTIEGEIIKQLYAEYAVNVPQTDLAIIARCEMRRTHPWPPPKNIK